ncbi:hypothetical protein NNC19_22350 [Clostridium sp. SHJSY1]|uniref:deaminase domain-containing protein n=1 Tax=Clostridium sp. SHJSY1 TaxID=2942483 RepID=UPI0028755440|nr:deaminase domain-containing protein [Clostridium sp. SHJSY1]MDS0528434.1 hypothetical protein [Clostridium sp. SHJSY1]
MNQIDIVSKKRKRERIKISSIYDFKDVLRKEGYDVNELDDEKFKKEITRIFKLEESAIERVHKYIKNIDITYKVNNAEDFIDYIEKMILFEKEHNKLCEKIGGVKKIDINRIEYEREVTSRDNVEDIINAIEELKSNISIVINNEEKSQIENLQKEIDKEYLFAKDIELLKKMIITSSEKVTEKYNSKTKTKTLSIEISKNIDCHYIKAKKGTVEYHEHLINIIPRMQRLTRNIKKYMKAHEKEKTTFKIDQSKTLQDSINIAIAIFHNKEFKAISGSNDIKNYCTSPLLYKAIFKSSKVNKLGELGVGYNRINDSEKKIFEEINKQIEAKLLKDEGNLVLYSKWEPCPSCYFVIYQFCKKYPKIKVEVKYNRGYGE